MPPTTLSQISHYIDEEVARYMASNNPVDLYQIYCTLANIQTLVQQAELECAQTGDMPA